ncbi:MAG: coat protein [Mesorhizobium sp.]|nr:MAG: coat protein [Mesorhizobium sp.]
MALNEGQMVAYAVSEVVETLSNLTPMAQKVEKYTPPGREMQRSDNTIWMPLEQEAPTQKGWDLTGKTSDLLELSVSVSIGEPDNDYFRIRADDVRDETTYRRRIQASAKKLASNVEQAIAQKAVDMGSLFVSEDGDLSANADGWGFVARAEKLLFERELNRDMGISFFFNANDYINAGYDLAGKDFYGRIAEEAYTDGTIGRQVAGFNDVLRSPKLPSLPAATATGVTVSGAQSFKPQAYTDNPDGGKTNVDNRFAVVNVSSGTGFKRGDKIKFAGVKFLAQMAKNVLTDDATFSVVAVNGNAITITPKPIALNDVSLTTAERAYANVNTSLAAGAAISLLNIDTAMANVFWANDAIRLVSQPIPIDHELFSGMKSESFSIPDIGLNGVIGFQGNLATLSGDCRIALWYEPSVVRPEAVGVALANQTP